VASAINISGFRMPKQKIVVNLAPADIKKEGSSYDLPIAIGILAASGQIPSDELDNYFIMGELSLDWTIQPIKGALPIAIQAQQDGFKGFILPKQNVREAGIVNDLIAYGVENLAQVIAFFNKSETLEQVKINTKEEFLKNINNYEHDFADVKGQENIKRAFGNCSSRWSQCYFNRSARSWQNHVSQTPSNYLTPIKFK